MRVGIAVGVRVRVRARACLRACVGVCVCTIGIDVKLHYAAGACGTHVLPHAMKLWT